MFCKVLNESIVKQLFLNFFENQPEKLFSRPSKFLRSLTHREAALRCKSMIPQIMHHERGCPYQLL